MDKTDNDTRSFLVNHWEEINIWGGFKITYTIENFEQPYMDVVAYILRKYREYLNGGVLTKEWRPKKTLFSSKTDKGSYVYKWEFRFYMGKMKDLPKDTRDLILDEKNWRFIRYDARSYAVIQFMKLGELNALLPGSVYNEVCAGARQGRIKGLEVSDCDVYVGNIRVKKED